MPLPILKRQFTVFSGTLACLLITCLVAACGGGGGGGSSTGASTAGSSSPAPVVTSSACTQTSASTLLATIITNSAGAYTTNSIANNACPNDVTYSAVNGKCYGNYAVQPNAYQNPPANTNFSMWSNSASCWGINVTDSTANEIFWNAPEVTRGFSFGYNGLLTPSGGIRVSALNTQYASSATPCPSTGTSGGVCAKWSMSVPGVAPQSAANTATITNTKWNALMDIYFHATATPASGQDTTFDLQIYQMVMDFNKNGVPNWATNIVAPTHYTKKTIGGVTYLVSANMFDPFTEGTSYVGQGGSNNAISMFPLPTYPTTGSTGSYLWGQASLVHDIAGIIQWLSQPQTIGGVTGIFDDAGHLLYDNVRHTNITSALLNPNFYLTGFNPGFEVNGANASSSYPNNTVFTTTNFWVALPGETIGN